MKNLWGLIGLILAIVFILYAIMASVMNAHNESIDEKNIILSNNALCTEVDDYVKEVRGMYKNSSVYITMASGKKFIKTKLEWENGILTDETMLGTYYVCE